MSYREVSEIRDGMRIDWDMPIKMDDGLVLRADVREREVTVRATPANAEIVIDEKLHAKGRFVGKLPFGTHAWVATAPDHVERRGTFDVDEDTAARLG